MAEESAARSETSDKNGQSRGVRDLIERTFLAGMGAAALTKDRLQELVDEFISRGQIDREEGREVVDRLVARSREEARSLLKRADSSLQGAYRELGLTPKRELEGVLQRIEQLEHRVALLEAAVPGTVRPEAADGSTK